MRSMDPIWSLAINDNPKINTKSKAEFSLARLIKKKHCVDSSNLKVEALDLFWRENNNSKLKI